MLGTLMRHARQAVHEAQFRRLRQKYAEYTMIPEQIYVHNLMLARTIHSLPGSIAECGVWRGGMMAGLAELLGPDRHYYLFDSFEGLPPVQDIDGPAAKAWQARTAAPCYFDNCTAEIRFAREAMELSGARHFHLLEGWFENTMPGFVPEEPIVLLRLDADWYESTMACLDNLYQHLAPNALIVVDDYYVWDGCAKAIHAFLAKHNLPLRIKQRYGDVCVLRVPATCEPSRQWAT